MRPSVPHSVFGLEQHLEIRARQPGVRAKPLSKQIAQLVARFWPRNSSGSRVNGARSNVRFGNWNPQRSPGAPLELGRVTDALQCIDPVWDVLYPEEQRRVLELLVERIKVLQDHVEVRLHCNGIEQIVAELRPAARAEVSTAAQGSQDLLQKYPGMTVFREDNAVVVRIPVNFRRRNGRQMVLTCGGEERPAQPDRQVNSALVSAVAKAYRWQEQLESGQYASLEELAAANGVDRSYAGRILRLTSLSPEIVEAILDGNEPKGLTLAKLHKRLPLIWSEQRWD